MSNTNNKPTLPENLTLPPDPYSPPEGYKFNPSHAQHGEMPDHIKALWGWADSQIENNRKAEEIERERAIDSRIIESSEEILEATTQPIPNSSIENISITLPPKGLSNFDKAQLSINPDLRSQEPLPNQTNFQKAARFYGKRSPKPPGKEKRKGKAINFDLPSEEAHEVFKQVCARYGVSQSKMLTFLVMESISQFNAGLLDLSKWQTASQGRPTREESALDEKFIQELAKAISKELKLTTSIEAGAKKSSTPPAQPIICGIKFPKIPPMIEQAWEGCAWPVGNLRHLTEEEYQELHARAITTNFLALQDTRFIDEAGNYFDSDKNVWRQGMWRPSGGTTTSYEAIRTGKWCPETYDWRVASFISFHKDGLKRVNLRHLDPTSEYYGQPAWKGVKND